MPLIAFVQALLGKFVRTAVGHQMVMTHQQTDMVAHETGTTVAIYAYPVRMTLDMRHRDVYCTS